MNDEIEALLNKILRRTEYGSHDTTDDLKRDLRHIAQHAKEARELVGANVGAEWINPDLEHMAEEAECAHMVLDDLGAPKGDDGGKFSLVGRIKAALAVGAGWQDIETAPTDGRWVLTFTPSRVPVFAVMWWSGIKWVDERDDWYVNGPTHWRPLQAPSNDTLA